MGEPTFSSALKLTDLDDFITPSQACIKPELIQRKDANKRVKIEVKTDGTYIEIGSDGNEVLESAKISLNDCLACSGCVTSAETVLITAQSTKEFFKNVGIGKTVVISISPQSRASLAAHFNLDIKTVLKKLISMFKLLGCHYVFDTSFAREFALMEAAAEFISRFKEGIAPVPMLTSECPGWICYAEKELGDFVLPYISTTKSSQQIMGTIVKYFFSKRLNLEPTDIYHTTIMPCYDKKLEASRDDFYSDIFKTRDVDCVLATTEIFDILKEKNIDFMSLPEASIDPLFTNINTETEQLFGTHGTSGGYAEYVFRKAAKEIFNVQMESIQFKPIKKNTDFQVVNLEVDGKIVLSFALAYGFRHIVNIAQKLKRTKNSKSYPYHFVEIMACPSGCLNGGGQIRAEKEETPAALLRKVSELYHQQTQSLPEDNAVAQQLYQLWFDGCFSPDAKTNLHTQYHAREKIKPNSLLIKW